MKNVIVSDIHGNFVAGFARTMEAKRPKGKASIPIVAQLKTLLDRHRAECGNPIRGFVFANASGNAMNLEALARDVIRPAIKESGLEWHGRHAFRRGLPTNLHRLGISDNVIQQILRHANVTTTMDIYVKTVTSDAAAAMKTLQTTCATTVQPLPLASTGVIRNALGATTRKALRWMELRESGGEGGIRTLGTGVSPYNGLAN